MKQAKFVISNYTGSDFPRCIFVECGGITGETLMGADAMQPSVPTACIGILIPTQVATSVDGSSTIVYTGL